LARQMVEAEDPVRANRFGGAPASGPARTAQRPKHERAGPEVGARAPAMARG
jgi:hypothetical protein